MAGRLGETDLAAHSIVLNAASFTFMFPLGISLGAVTRVGHLIGERRYHRAQRAAWISFGLGGGIMTVSGLAFTFAPGVIARAFTTDPAVVASAISVFPIAGAFQIFDGVQVIGGGVLRGMGRARPAAVFNFLGYYVLALPAGAWLAFDRGYGLRGVWWGCAIGLGIVAVSLVLWIRSRGPITLRERVDGAGGSCASGRSRPGVSHPGTDAPSIPAAREV